MGNRYPKTRAAIVRVMHSCPDLSARVAPAVHQMVDELRAMKKLPKLDWTKPRGKKR